MSIQAYAAHEARQPLTLWQYEPQPLGALDVDVEITHCGICHSDLHLVDGEWGGSFPKVVGHEIIGIIRAVGSAVDPARLGQRVGIGWQRSTCLDCTYCLRGEENMCHAAQATCKENYGGFARAIRLDSRFCHPIPDALDSVNAAPLLCAGITVYSPLRRYGADATTRVGVVGIGGLGHLAVQYARAMGCHVTAFTTTPAKAEEAHALGADRAVITTQEGALKSVRNSIDLLIVTVAVPLDWLEYAKALRRNGTLCFVGASPDDVRVPIGLLIGNQWQLTGSSIGGRALMREMLAFSAQHGVVAQTELLPFSEVNTALDRLRRNDVRYRFVLAWE